MTLWFAFAVMTALAAIGIVWPLWRKHDAHRSGSDVVVYRDQLDEIGRDRVLGLIGPAEAEAARIEVSRRLLAAADQGKRIEKAPDAPRWRRHTVFAASLTAITLGASALYLRLGTPSMAFEASTPAQASAVAAGDSVEQLIARAENYLTHNPRDARAWEMLAPVYMRVGRYGDAANAWRNVIQLSGENGDRLADLGEALVAEANGVVTADAKSAFVRATAIDPKSVSGRYYLALAAEQDGRRDEAAQIFRSLVADAPPGAHWVAQVRDAIARLDGQPAKSLPGPTPAQMLAAAKEPPTNQQAMIRSMVARLAARLKQDGSDPDGWARLVRSYSVLGEPEQARAAAADARRALAADPDKLTKLESALKGDGPEAPPATSAATPPAAQAAMPQHDVADMVARLAARLKQTGSDPEGWLMLTRSYVTLGQKDKAAGAIRDARQALAGDPDKLVQFDDSIRRFNLEDGLHR